jgi:hypothetical protein
MANVEGSERIDFFGDNRKVKVHTRYAIRQAWRQETPSG